MRIHHFYPRTRNIGDHFVQLGIAKMIREIVPEATFELFDVNSRGSSTEEYGLTAAAVARANQNADLIVVGGSNLYEGSFGWPWGVHLELAALKSLRVPLMLLGLGTGSSFASPLHRPSARAQREIKALNDYATLSGVRDTTTLEWLEQLGISTAKLMGDPAASLFNFPLQIGHYSHILLAVPPRRMWTSKRQFFRVRTTGRPIFTALVGLTRSLLEKGQDVVVVCNDPMDLPVAQELFGTWLPRAPVCPQTPEEYFKVLAQSRAVISGRLHTAVVAFSLGLPFLLIDVDSRTHGFLQTYELEQSSVAAASSNLDADLNEQAEALRAEGQLAWWQSRIEQRDQLHSSALDVLKSALESIF